LLNKTTLFDKVLAQRSRSHRKGRRGPGLLSSRAGISKKKKGVPGNALLWAFVIVEKRGWWQQNGGGNTGVGRCQGGEGVKRARV